jgi:hypothetical protein
MKKPVSVLIILLFISFGCGKDSLKPSADSIITKEALNRIEIIKGAYEEKDSSTLRRHLAPEVAIEILRGLYFDKAELYLSPQMVEIKAKAIMVHLNWDGKWIVKGKEIRDRGIADLVFDEDTMRLIRVDGDNPFHTPGIREQGTGISEKL